MKRSLLAMLLLGSLGQPASAEPAPDWAKDAVESLKREGILQGYPEPGTDEERPANRNELAELLERLDEGRTKKEAEFAPRSELEDVRDEASRTKTEAQQLEHRIEALEESTDKLQQRRDATRRPGF